MKIIARLSTNKNLCADSAQGTFSRLLMWLDNNYWHNHCSFLMKAYFIITRGPMFKPGFCFGDAVFDNDKYIKVIGITAVLLLFGLINSVSAIVFTEPSGYARSDFNIYPGSSNERDIQSAFIFESGNNVNFSVAFADTMTDQGQTYLMPPIGLAPTSALHLGYDLGVQVVKNKKDYLFSFTNPSFTESMVNIKWRDIFSGNAPETWVGHSVMIEYPTEWTVGSQDNFKALSNIVATKSYQVAYDPAKGSRIAEWSPGVPVGGGTSDPATLAFLGLGLIGIGIMRWRKVFSKKYVFRLMPRRELYAFVSSAYVRNR